MAIVKNFNGFLHGGKEESSIVSEVKGGFKQKLIKINRDIYP